MANLPITRNRLLDVGHMVLEGGVAGEIPATRNRLLDVGHFPIESGPYVTDRSPFDDPACVDADSLTVDFRVGVSAPRTVDNTTVLVQLSQDYAAAVTVYDGGSGGYQSGYSGSASAGGTLFDDYIDFSWEPDAGFDATSVFQVLVFADDDLGNPITPPVFWSFATCPSITVTLSLTTVDKLGGVLISAESTVPDGRYRVYVGPTQTIVDPVCYAGFAADDRSFVQVTNGAFDFVVPISDVGGPYGLLLVDIDTSTSYASDPLLTVVPHQFASKTLGLRRLFPPKWRVGWRKSEYVAMPQ